MTKKEKKLRKKENMGHGATFSGKTNWALRKKRLGRRQKSTSQEMSRKEELVGP